MCCPKGWVGCLNGVALLSKIPVPPFGTLYTQYRSFSFQVEVLHGKGDSILCAPRSCTGKDLLRDIVFTPFSNIFCSFGCVSFISSSYGAKYTGFTKTLYMARRSTRLLSFLLQRGGTTRPGGTVVNWRLLVMAAEPGFPGEV